MSLPERSMTTEEVAEAFGVSILTVRRMIADGRLPAVKIASKWRVRPEVVTGMLGISA